MEARRCPPSLWRLHTHSLPRVIAQIFTFMRMGGSTDRIDLRLMANADEDQGNAREQLMAKLADFDAAKAQCFKTQDRERLLAVIEAAFGDFKEFNKRVRAVFATRVSRPSHRKASGVAAVQLAAALARRV